MINRESIDKFTGFERIEIDLSAIDTRTINIRGFGLLAVKCSSPETVNIYFNEIGSSRFSPFPSLYVNSIFQKLIIENTTAKTGENLILLVANNNDSRFFFNSNLAKIEADIAEIKSQIGTYSWSPWITAPNVTVPTGLTVVYSNHMVFNIPTAVHIEDLQVWGEFFVNASGGVFIYSGLESSLFEPLNLKPAVNTNYDNQYSGRIWTTVGATIRRFNLKIDTITWKTVTLNAQQLSFRIWGVGVSTGDSGTITGIKIRFRYKTVTMP